MIKMEKGRRVVLTMQQRVDVLKDLESSTIAHVAKKYKIHLRTVRRIQKNAAEINNFANKGKQEKRRKNFRKPMYEELDERLLVWFAERKALGHAVSDALLLGKAAEFKEECGSCSNFKVSKGWLTRFKRRHHIRLGRKDREEASTHQDVSNSFVSDFQKYIEEEGINVKNIYNMYKTRLLWKALPLETLERETKECACVYKMLKDRVTLWLCVNAAGTHKIMPLVIHNFENQFLNQLFIDWFENHFKKDVRKYQLDNKLCGKVILLVDDCISHEFPSNYEYDDYFEVKYLPPNTTSLFQPMDQGLIEKLKRCFRYKLTQHLIASEYNIEDFYEVYTIKDCINMISESWENLPCNNIKNVWKNIIPNMESNEKEIKEENITSEMQQAWADFSEQDITVEDIENYFTACRKEEQKLFGIFEHINKDEDEDRDKEINEERNKQRDEEYGIKLPPEIRKELEDIFKRIERCKKYVPRSVQCLLEGAKLTILGDTTSKKNTLS